MFAAIRKYQLKSGVNGQLNKALNEAFLPIVSSVPGFVAYHGVDSGSNEWASITIFESREAAEESNRRAAAFMRDRVETLVASGPEIVIGDVVVSKRN
jgi:heme-degrading monooxygenase HmoA